MFGLASLISDIENLVEKNGLSVTLIIVGVGFFIYFIRVLLDEDKTSLWRAKVYRCLFFLTGKIDKEKKYISNDIKARINLARRRFHFGKQRIPQVEDIKWISGATGEIADIKEDQFIVKLDPSKNQYQNISIFAAAVIRRTTLLGLRHVISENTKTGIDINLVKKIVENLKNRAVLDWFFENEYYPIVNMNQEIRCINEKIVMVDTRGLFCPVLLSELNDYAKRISTQTAQSFMKEEIDAFIQFLYDIASKQLGVNVDLEYKRTYICVGIILVAKTDKIFNGIEPYVRVMEGYIKNEVDSIYVIIWKKDYLKGDAVFSEKDFFLQIDLLLERYSNYPSIELDFDIEYDFIESSGNRRRARCLRYFRTI